MSDVSGQPEPRFEPRHGFTGVEPGGPADEFVEAVSKAAVNIASLIESINWEAEGLQSRMDELEKKIEALNEKLDNFVKVLSSVFERHE